MYIKIQGLEPFPLRRLLITLSAIKLLFYQGDQRFISSNTATRSPIAVK